MKNEIDDSSQNPKSNLRKAFRSLGASFTLRDRSTAELIMHVNVIDQEAQF